jgi:hypothetical protein
MSEDSTHIGTTIPLPRTFVIVQASIWDSEPEEGRTVEGKGMKGTGSTVSVPLRVIDSLRYVSESRHYSAHGRTPPHRAIAPPGSAGSRLWIEELIGP